MPDEDQDREDDAASAIPSRLRTSSGVTDENRTRALPEPSRLPIHVICDNVRSLFNVGAIFRLCDATRVERLHLCGITGHPAYPGDPRRPWVAERADREIARSATRAIPYVPWEYHPSAADVIATLKGRGMPIVALELTPASVSYADADYPFPLGLVLGHEREGVAPPILSQVDFAVRIPMYGQGTSLNVAVAFGICVYEIARRYDWR